MKGLAYSFLILLLSHAPAHSRGTGDMGVLIERASSSVQIVETSNNSSLARVS
ncbi:MAG: protein nirF, partial [Gammaproteobacteria bacterium]|nr:protein nirF [Gammaproteobacteria bacterium]